MTPKSVSPAGPLSALNIFMAEAINFERDDGSGVRFCKKRYLSLNT